MGRFNNRRAQERAAQQRNVPSRARFSKGPPPKKNSVGRGIETSFGRGGGGGMSGRGTSTANDAVVQKIQDRVDRQRRDIGGISIVTKNRKAHPLDGIDVSKLDTVALSAESVAIVERLLRAYNVWEEASNNDDEDDGVDDSEEKKQEPAHCMSDDNFPTHSDAFSTDHYDDYFGDYDDEPDDQCSRSQDIKGVVRGEDIMCYFNSDEGRDNKMDDSMVADKEYNDSPSFLHLTQHYSFNEQDAILALNACNKRIRLSKKSNNDISTKDDGIILEMALDWLSLHLNESDLHRGFRVSKPKPPSQGISCRDRLMPNTVPIKIKAVPHESISIMPKLTRSQYEKEARESAIRWKRQWLTTEFIRMGFHTQEVDIVFASVEDELEMIFEKIPDSIDDEVDNEPQLLLLLENKLLARLLEFVQTTEASDESTYRQDIIDEKVDEMAKIERDQEKEVLEAIYAERFQSVNSFSDGSTERNRYVLQVIPTTILHPPAQNDKCYLHVLTSRGYPIVQSPLVWFFNGGFPPSLLRRINVSLITKAKEQLGQASVYEMMEYLAENLTSWQKQFIDEEASAEKAIVLNDDDEKHTKKEEASDNEEIDYFTTTFTFEERKKLSRRQRQKLIAAEKLYSRDAIVLEKYRLKQEKHDELRQRIQLENKTISSRMADKEINKRWLDFVQDEAERASRKAMNDAFLRGEGREEARAAAENARLEVLRFHGELEEKDEDGCDHSNANDSSTKIARDVTNVNKAQLDAEDRVDTNQLRSYTSSAATPKTLLFVEKLRKMYEQKAKEKAEGVDAPGYKCCTVRLANPSSNDAIDLMALAPTPVVANSPGVEEVIDEITSTQRNQPWLIAPDARVPFTSELCGFHASKKNSIDEVQKKEKTSKSLRADLKRKYKCSGPFHDMLSQRTKLPAYKMRVDLVTMIRNSQVTVVSGDTGCGKTTQVPQLVLDDMIQNNLGADANIICTQPRRISAIGVSERIAAERCEKVGQTVGYSIRLESKRSRQTRLLLCTTGVLLRRLQVDPDLSTVSHVFVDEVHERDLNTDFLLIILRDLLRRRKTLKLVLMSATLNAECFSEYFGGAPIISIPGRAQPVTEFRLEDCLEVTGHIVLEDSEYAVKNNGKDNSDRLSKTSLRRLYPNYSKNVINSLANVDESLTNYVLIGDLLEYICKQGEEGAVLIFLPGMAEIKTAMEEISKREYFQTNNTVIYPLHSSLSNAEQIAIFQRPPKGKRKIVFSSNIAETSITIDDVVFVIDSGRVKENRYDDLNMMPTLTECWVSKASARQRKGRAGRVKPGFCFHLFSSHTHDNILDDYQLPEMLRVGLEDLILQILVLDLGSPTSFLAKAVNPPTELQVKSALQLLESLGAAEIDWVVNNEDGSEFGVPTSLTALGYHLATLPVHPRVGKMLIYGTLFGVFDPCLTIAAAMTCRNPFVSSFDNRDCADEAKRTFASDDHISVLLAFHQWRSLKRVDGRKCRAFLQENFLSYQALANIAQLRNQLKRYMSDIGFVTPSSEKHVVEGNDLSLVRAVISAAFSPNIIISPKKLGGLTAGEVPFRGKKGDVYLHPSTIAFSAKELDSRYCCYHEIVKTSKVYVRDCTTISKFSLLLFGGSLQVYQNKGVVTVDDWLKFRCDAKPATLVKYLRQSMEALLLEKIMDPSIDMAGSVKGRAVIDSVTSLLKMET